MSYSDDTIQYIWEGRPAMHQSPGFTKRKKPEESLSSIMARLGEELVKDLEEFEDFFQHLSVELESYGNVDEAGEAEGLFVKANYWRNVIEPRLERHRKETRQ